MNLDQLDAIP
jgi:hypothetical protein